jgi:hypothetical protein
MLWTCSAGAHADAGTSELQCDARLCNFWWEKGAGTSDAFREGYDVSRPKIEVTSGRIKVVWRGKSPPREEAG